MCSSLPVGRVIESGRLAGAEWQPWGPWDQCFDNKCLLLFGPGGLMSFVLPLPAVKACMTAPPCQGAPQTGTSDMHLGPRPHPHSQRQRDAKTQKFYSTQSQGCHSNAVPALNTLSMHEWK